MPVSDHASQRPLFGIAAMLGSVLFFGTMDALVKWLSADYPTWQIMFFRSSVALVPIAVFVAMAGGWRVLHTGRPALLAVRSIIGVSAMGCAFYGIGRLPLADAMAIFHAAPILMTALSVPLLGEKVGIRRWSAVLIGFLGVLLVVRPGGAVFSHAALFMMAAAFLVALATNIIRILSRTEDPASITFYFTLSATLVSGVLSLLWGWNRPPLADILLLMAVGVLGGCAQYLMTLSFKNAEIGLVSPLKYLMIVFGGVIGYFVWGEIPDHFSLLGIAIIISAGGYTMRREARLNRRIITRRVPDPGR
jgi:drug/metabolite transporter (DMT)-like permease